MRQTFSVDRTVDFIICGAQKGGTTALDAYLREHPQICMANNKEVHFFDNESNFLKKDHDYSKYHSFFSPQKKHDVIGEATPIYMYWNNAPKRIWNYNPNMKLILLLRNPIDRAYSHWNMEQLRNADNLSFFDAIKNEKSRCLEAFPYQHRVYSYIDRGLYVEQLQRLKKYFPSNQILILKSEYLKKQPDKALENICTFLDIAPFESVEAKNIHSHPYKSKMSQEEREYLRLIFEPEIKNLEQMLNWDCKDWC